MPSVRRGSGKLELGIAPRFAPFEHIASARGIGIDASVDDLSVPDPKQEQGLVLHRKTTLGLRPRDHGNDDIVFGLENGPCIVVEVLVLLVHVLPEGLELSLAVVGAAVWQ